MTQEGQRSVTGMVLLSVPAGEYDRRVVLLTREAGKLSCFARGARKQGSPLMAACSPFVFGRFQLRALRSGYVLTEASVQNYFAALREDASAAYYGMYFLEAAELVTREELDASGLLALLYRSCEALLLPSIPNRLVRAIFELKLIMTEGEFPGLDARERESCSSSMQYAVRFIEQSEIARLYTFCVREEILEELEAFSARLCRRFFDHEFRSLEILKLMESP